MAPDPTDTSSPPPDLDTRSVDLAARWAELTDDAGLPASPDTGRGIVERYAEPHRRYHGVNHLVWVLTALDDLAEGPPAPETRLAAWYHDAVYQPTQDDNEAASATLARAELSALGLAEDRVALVEALVLATADHQPHDLPEAALLLDADLSTLGAPADVFDGYSRGVREEYAHVPDELYEIGRPAVLQSFLDRRPIYLTERGRDRFEAQARSNLAREIASLATG